MGYIEVADTICNVLMIVGSLAYMQFGFFMLVGLFFKKKYPENSTKLKYGMIIPARNEEKVVGNLIKSIQNADYPQDKVQIFVIAHNCTDKTAEVARSLGATVYEYDNPDECTMGYAFRHLFKCIEKDYGTQNFDGFFIFNADNTVDKEYFSKMNDAFLYYDRKNIITSYRNAANWDGGIISAMYGIYFSYGCIFEGRGRTALGISTRVSGTGYVINSELVKNGWNYVTLTEDWELTADQIIRKNKIAYCDAAMFYDEQPTKNKIMVRQRFRWQLGHLLVFKQKYFELIKGIFGKNKRGDIRFSMFDFSANVFPFCTAVSLIFLLRFVLYLFAPLSGIPLGPLMTEFGKDFLLSLAEGYGTLLVTIIILCITQRKRIAKTRPWVLILAVLIFPVFFALSFPLEWVSFFKKNAEWKPIPHTGKKSSKIINASGTMNTPKAV